MVSPLMGEFMGTAILILMGNGVVANVLLKKSKGEDSGWIVIAGLVISCSAVSFGCRAARQGRTVLPDLARRAAWSCAASRSASDTTPAT